MSIIAADNHTPLEDVARVRKRPGASLLFPAGTRPTAAMLVRLFGSARMAGLAAQVCHCSDEEGKLEVLANGLTFDLRGLAPAEPAKARVLNHLYGFKDGTAALLLEAVEIIPGAHIATAGRISPVLGTLAGLTANLALDLPVAAAAWHGAETCVEPRFFSRSVLNWRAGGAFPALGLTALLPASDGGAASKGLAAFTGQEFQLAGAPEETQAETLKLAARVADYLVRNGRLTEAQEIVGLGVSLCAEPSRFADLVWVWRG